MTANNKGGNKEHIGGHEPVTTPEGRMDLTKSGKAYQIFDEMHKADENVARKDCLDRAVKDADMTPASAATFYQKWRDMKGLVHRTEDDNHTQPSGHTGSTKGPTASKK